MTTLTTCKGKISPSNGICDTCYQPAMSTSGQCGRLLEEVKVMPDAEKILKDNCSPPSLASGNIGRQASLKAMHQYGNELLSLLRKQVEDEIEFHRKEIKYLRQKHPDDYNAISANLTSVHVLQEVINKIDKLKKP